MPALLASLFLVSLSQPARAADAWEANVDGNKAYTEVKDILAYKAGQAAEVEAIFYGLRDSLYVMSPTSQTQYQNSFLTPKTVTYTVTTKAAYSGNAVVALQLALTSAKYLKQGDRKVTFKFPSVGEISFRVYDEIFPTYEKLVRGGYAFEARAVLLDKDQGVLATSDNSLLLSTPTLGDGLDFSGTPLLRSYERAEPPDLTELFYQLGDKREGKAAQLLRDYLAKPSYALSSKSTATFYSLPVEDLKRIVSCRVLRDSDQLLLYKEQK
jgi:hypothetical protein